MKEGEEATTDDERLRTPGLSMLDKGGRTNFTSDYSFRKECKASYLVRRYKTVVRMAVSGWLARKGYHCCARHADIEFVPHLIFVTSPHIGNLRLESRQFWNIKFLSSAAIENLCCWKGHTTRLFTMISIYKDCMTFITLRE